MPETSLPPPPPKGSGSGPYIGAAAVMLAAMAGLILWKVGKDKEQAEEAIIIAPPAASTTAAPHFDAPPPPPPDIEPDAGKPKEEEKKTVSKGKKGAGVWKGGAASCGGECTGTVTPKLMSEIRSRQGSARGCYERALRNNAMLQGKLTVTVSIGSTGNVCGARVTRNTLGDPSIANCVVQKFLGAKLSPPNGGCVHTSIPLNFVPKQ